MPNPDPLETRLGHDPYLSVPVPVVLVGRDRIGDAPPVIPGHHRQRSGRFHHPQRKTVLGQIRLHRQPKDVPTARRTPVLVHPNRKPIKIPRLGIGNHPPVLQQPIRFLFIGRQKPQNKTPVLGLLHPPDVLSGIDRRLVELQPFLSRRVLFRLDIEFVVPEPLANGAVEIDLHLDVLQPADQHHLRNMPRPHHHRLMPPVPRPPETIARVIAQVVFGIDLIGPLRQLDGGDFAMVVIVRHGLPRLVDHVDPIRNIVLDLPPLDGELVVALEDERQLTLPPVVQPAPTTGRRHQHRRCRHRRQKNRYMSSIQSFHSRLSF